MSYKKSAEFISINKRIYMRGKIILTQNGFHASISSGIVVCICYACRFFSLLCSAYSYVLQRNMSKSVPYCVWSNLRCFFHRSPNRGQSHEASFSWLLCSSTYFFFFLPKCPAYLTRLLCSPRKMCFFQRSYVRLFGLKNKSERDQENS